MPENATPDNAHDDHKTVAVKPDPRGPDQLDDLGDRGSLTVEDTPFAIVPEWVITAPITDAAFRVYTLLLRYGGTSGCRMPSRALLARRLNKSVDTIDRALRELSTASIVRIEHRHNGHHYKSNRYHLRTTDPTKPATTPVTRGGRTDAATAPSTTASTQTSRTDAGTPGRRNAGTPGRRSAARVAANLRHYPEVLTQRQPPPPPVHTAATSTPTGTATTAGDTLAIGGGFGAAAVLAACGITDLSDLTARCVAARSAQGQPTGRWTPHALALAIQLAVTHRGWPPAAVIPALLAVAADPATRSPVRLAEAGPWWDTPTTATGMSNHDISSDGGLTILEARLAETGGQRPALQAQARTELTNQGLPLTRSTVTRRAAQILDRLQAPA